jgi:hypothetical protein
MSKIEHSGKITLIINILRRCSCDKVQVFNQSLHSLNLVEEFLAGEDERYRVKTTKKVLFPAVITYQ